jgi:hypothetical protein
MNLLGELMGSVQELMAPGRATALRHGALVQVHNRSVRIGGVIAEGGCATVYDCEDASTGERFALKHMLLDGDQRQVRGCSQRSGAVCNCLVRAWAKLKRTTHWYPRPPSSLGLGF